MWSIPIWLTFLHCVRTSYELYFWDGLNTPTRCSEVEAALPGLNPNEYHGIEELNSRERESKQTSQLHRNWTSRTIFICWPDTYLRMGFPLSVNWRVIKAGRYFSVFHGLLSVKEFSPDNGLETCDFDFCTRHLYKVIAPEFLSSNWRVLWSLVSTESMDNIV